MLLRIAEGGRITLPTEVLESMGARPGDRLRLEEGPDGFVLRLHRSDSSRPAPLHTAVRPATEPFDIHAFRTEAHDPALRD